MTALLRTLSFTLVFAILAIIGFAGYGVIEYLVTGFRNIDATVAYVAIFAFGGLLASAAVIAASISRGAKTILARILVEDKVRAYQLFVDFWSRGLPNTGIGDHSARALRDLGQMLVLHGSPSVIKAHLALGELRTKDDQRNSEARKLLAESLLEARKDIGRDVHGLAGVSLEALLFGTDGAAQDFKVNSDAGFATDASASLG